VKDIGRKRACNSIQEIETDLVYRMIETFQQGQTDVFLDSLDTYLHSIM